MLENIKVYKLRKLTTNNLSGDAYGITIPREISKQFLHVNFRISKSGNSILLESGCSHDKY